MLQAKIFTANETAVNGQIITIAHLALAVNAFNATQSCHMVVFDEYPGRAPVVQLDRVAATARLDMDGQNVIATINFMETPLGKIASQLHESGVGLQIVPVTTTVPTANWGEPQLQIRQLIIPSTPQFSPGDTALRKVQAWVEGSEHWPIFELKEHKY
jgi:hypothetical protein